MLKEDRVLKYLAKSDAAVASGEKTVNESLDEVRLLLSRPRGPTVSQGSILPRHR